MILSVSNAILILCCPIMEAWIIYFRRNSFLELCRHTKRLVSTFTIFNPLPEIEVPCFESIIDEIVMLTQVISLYFVIKVKHFVLCLS